MAIIFSNSKSAYYKAPEQVYEPSTNFFEKEIHDRQLIEKKLKLKQAQLDEQIANKITEYLRQVKQILTNNTDNIYNEFGEEELALAVNSLMGKSLFQYKGLNASQKGAAFEQHLAQILETLISASNNQNIEVKITGQDLGTSKILYTKEQLERMLKKDISEITRKGLVQVVQGRNKSPNLYRLTLKDIKTDIEVTGKIQKIGKIDLNSEINLDNFAKLVAGRKFSLKNYSRTNITLGQTNNIRVFSSALSFLNPKTTADDVEKIFFSNLAKDNNGHVLHRSHMRFIYELTGIGQVSELGQDLGAVDFLIFNKANSLSYNSIKVISAKKMIVDYLNSNKSSSSNHISYSVKLDN